MTPAIDWTTQPLGQLPDARLAAILGVAAHVVRHHRTRAGLPGYRTQREAAALQRTPPQHIDWSAQPLGQLPDSALAKRLGTYPAAVAFQRKQRGLPAYEPPGTAPPADYGPARHAAWAAYPATGDLCRCCLEGLTRLPGGNRRAAPRRWTDQGPICAAHYAALPPCRRCPAPVLEAGDLCDACTTALLWRQGEAAGWRAGGDPLAGAPAGLDQGSLRAIRDGLCAFASRGRKA
jgi:hypothetical protein